MKQFIINNVEVLVFMGEKGFYYGGFNFGYDDKRNYCGFLGRGHKNAFETIRRVIS